MASAAVETFRKNMAKRQEEAGKQLPAIAEMEVAPGIVRTKDGYVVDEDDFLIAASLAPTTVIANLNRLRMLGEVARLEITEGVYAGKIVLSGNAFEELMGNRQNRGFGVSEGDMGDYNGTPSRRGEAYMSAYEAHKPFTAFQRARDAATKLVKPTVLDKPGEFDKKQIKALLADAFERDKIFEMWNEFATHVRKESKSLTQLRERWYRDEIGRSEFEELRRRCLPTMDELVECWTHWIGYEKSLADEMNRRGISGPMLVADGFAALIKAMGI